MTLDSGSAQFTTSLTLINQGECLRQFSQQLYAWSSECHLDTDRPNCHSACESVF